MVQLQKWQRTHIQVSLLYSSRIRLQFYGYFYEENVTKSKHPPQFFLVLPLIHSPKIFTLPPPPSTCQIFLSPPLARYEKIHLPPLKIMKVTNIHLV